MYQAQKKYKAAVLTYDVEFGDICEVTDVKGMKGKLYVKLINTRNNRQINRFLDAGYKVKRRNIDGDWFEIDYNIKKPMDFSWDIFSAVQYNKIDIFLELIKNEEFLDTKKYHDTTLISFAACCGNIEIIKLLIDYEIKWRIFSVTNNLFIDYLNDDDKQEIRNKYPNIFEEYIDIKETVENSNKFNI